MGSNRSIHATQDEKQTEPTKEPAKDFQVEAEKSNAPGFEYNFCFTSPAHHQPEEKTDAKEETQESLSEPSQSAESSQQEDATPTRDGNDSPASTDVNGGGPAPKASKTTQKKFHSDDPIHWYGILVPPSLRKAQKSFTEGIQDQVLELAGATVEMRALEEKITQLRTELGTQSTEEVSP